MQGNNYTTDTNNSPCKGCETRSEACHGQCEKYANWKEFMKDVHKARKQYEIDWREEYKTLLTIRSKNGKIVYTVNCMHYFYMFR